MVIAQIAPSGGSVAQPSVPAPSDATTLDYRGPTPAPPRKAAVDLTHSGMSILRYLAMHVMGALFPITAGLMLYGPRAAGTMAILLLSAALSAAVWRRIGTRGLRVH